MNGAIASGLRSLIGGLGGGIISFALNLWKAERDFRRTKLEALCLAVHKYTETNAEVRAAMTFRKKLSSLAVAALLVPSIATAQEQASKYHHGLIYKGTIPIGLLTNGSDNHRAKAQLVFYPDGRLLVLSVESPRARNPMNIKGTLKKNVFTGEWKEGFFWSNIAFRVVFHDSSAVAFVTGKNAKPEKWYFSKEKAGGSRKKKKAADDRAMGGAGLKEKWGASEKKPSRHPPKLD